MKLRNYVWLLTVAIALATLMRTQIDGAAAETSAVDPTGTWKVTTIDPKTNAKSSYEKILKIKLEGGKLSGSITDRSEANGKVRIFEFPLKETKVQADEISFKISHPPLTGNGPEITSNYQGKIAGDKIKGKLESEWAGNTFARNWEASRSKE